MTFFPLGEDKFAAMLTELEQAEQFIFMEYFILKEGYMWEKILEILERKVQAGVEVRVMYDGTCAMFDLPFRYPELLKAKGIQCKMFAPYLEYSTWSPSFTTITTTATTERFL